MEEPQHRRGRVDGQRRRRRRSNKYIKQRGIIAVNMHRWTRFKSSLWPTQESGTVQWMRKNSSRSHKEKNKKKWLDSGFYKGSPTTDSHQYNHETMMLVLVSEHMTQEDEPGPANQV